jgi:hypothetical protein
MRANCNVSGGAGATAPHKLQACLHFPVTDKIAHARHIDSLAVDILSYDKVDRGRSPEVVQ